jgi:hypothetical protein
MWPRDVVMEATMIDRANTIRIYIHPPLSVIDDGVVGPASF